MSQGTITYTIKVDNSAVGPAITQTKGDLDKAASSATSFGTKLKAATDTAGNIATLANSALLLAFSWDSVQQAQIRAAKAQQSLKDKQDAAAKAQTAYNTAVATFGTNSPEAIKALDDLNDANNKVKIATEQADLKQKDLNQSYAFFATSAASTALSSFSSLEGVIGKLAKAAPGLTTALGNKSSGLSGALEGVSGGGSKVAGAIEGIGFAMLILQTGIATFDSFNADLKTFTDLAKGDFTNYKTNISSIFKGLTELPVIGPIVDQFGKFVGFQGELDKLKDPSAFWASTSKGITDFGTAIASVFTQTLPTWWDSLTKDVSAALATTYTTLASAVGGLADSIGKLFSGSLKLPDWWGSLTKGIGALGQGKNPFVVEASVVPKADPKVLQGVRDSISKAMTIPPVTVTAKGDTKPATTAFNTFKSSIKWIDTPKTQTINAKDNASKPISTIQRGLNGLKNKNLIVTVNYRATGSVQAQAAARGGISVSMHAKGGNFTTRGPRLLLVGDNPSGKERVRITPSENSSSGNDGGGGFNGTINVYVDGVLRPARYDMGARK